MIVLVPNTTPATHIVNVTPLQEKSLLLCVPMNVTRSKASAGPCKEGGEDHKSMCLQLVTNCFSKKSWHFLSVGMVKTYVRENLCH